MGPGVRALVSPGSDALASSAIWLDADESDIWYFFPLFFILLLF